MTDPIIEPESTSATSTDAAALKSLFATALELRNFEISQLVQRNNFFMIFQGVLLAGVMQSSHSKPIVSFLICSAGLAISVLQTMMAAGAKFWQEVWEGSLSQLEDLLYSEMKKSPDRRDNFFQLFHDDVWQHKQDVDTRLSRAGIGFVRKLVLAKFSVSRAPIYVGISLCLVWLLLVMCTLRAYSPLHVPSFVIGF